MKKITILLLTALLLFTAMMPAMAGGAYKFEPITEVPSTTLDYFLGEKIVTTSDKV